MANFSVDLQVYEQGRKRPEFTLVSDIGGEMTLQDLLEYTKASLIVIADEILREEQGQGFDKEPIVAVDGRVGKPVGTVSPLGQIEFTSRVDVMQIVFEAYEGVLYRSKVLTGRYKSSHFVFLNGIQIATSMQELQTWYNTTKPVFKDNDKIRIVNIQPYARKLERFGITAQRSKTRYEKGKKGGRFSGRLIQSPNGTYFLTARAVRAKYKRNSTIKFSYLTGATLGLAGVFKNAGRKGKGSAGRPYLYPTLIIAVSERGTV